MPNSMVVFGLGFSGQATAARMLADGWNVSGTTRSAQKQTVLNKEGISTHLFPGSDLAGLWQALDAADAVLLTIAPDPEARTDSSAGDPVLAQMLESTPDFSKKPWLGYLSTVGVYGNHDGAWVDETTECRPVSKRSKARLAAESAWQAFSDARDLPLAIFRLSGIYGPRRNPLEKLKGGKSRRINKPGQVFNRIHVDDIATAVCIAAKQRQVGIFNITDDEPAPPQDVVAHGAELLGVAPPPLVPFADADLSPMGRSFYGENKRVSNERSKKVLGMTYRYPSYREGLAALVAD